MVQDSVSLAKDITGLVNSILAILGLFVAAIAGAVARDVMIRLKIKSLESKSKEMQGAMAKHFEESHIKMDELESGQNELERDINLATQTWENKLHAFNRELEQRWLSQAEKCGSHNAVTMAVKATQEATTKTLDKIQKDIEDMRSMLFRALQDHPNHS